MRRGAGTEREPVTALEQAVAREIARHMDERWTVTVRSVESHVFVVGKCNGLVRSLRDDQPGVNDEIVSTWCRRIAHRLLRLGAS